MILVWGLVPRWQILPLILCYDFHIRMLYLNFVLPLCFPQNQSFAQILFLFFYAPDSRVMHQLFFFLLLSLDAVCKKVLHIFQFCRSKFLQTPHPNFLCFQVLPPLLNNSMRWLEKWLGFAKAVKITRNISKFGSLLNQTADKYRISPYNDRKSMSNGYVDELHRKGWLCCPLSQQYGLGNANIHLPTNMISFDNLSKLQYDMGNHHNMLQIPLSRRFGSVGKDFSMSREWLTQLWLEEKRKRAVRRRRRRKQGITLPTQNANTLLDTLSSFSSAIYSFTNQFELSKKSKLKLWSNHQLVNMMKIFVTQVLLKRQVVIYYSFIYFVLLSYAFSWEILASLELVIYILFH